jgi:hypothetical protein
MERWTDSNTLLPALYQKDAILDSQDLCSLRGSLLEDFVSSTALHSSQNCYFSIFGAGSALGRSCIIPNSLPRQWTRKSKDVGGEECQMKIQNTELLNCLQSEILNEA